MNKLIFKPINNRRHCPLKQLLSKFCSIESISANGSMVPIVQIVQMVQMVQIVQMVQWFKLFNNSNGSMVQIVQMFQMVQWFKLFKCFKLFKLFKWLLVEHIMGANSVKGLKVMETIYPSPEGKSVFDTNPKLKAKLDKEMAKSKTAAVQAEGDEHYVDGDMDAIVDKVIKSVWEYYDHKQKGFLDKKNWNPILQGWLRSLCVAKGCKSKRSVRSRN